jgi:transcriptional regulator GlxA family with amidase domain
MIRSSAGVVVESRAPPETVPDTLVVVGGQCRSQPPPPEIMAVIARLSAGARRVASVCTAAYLLAEAGLLDGRRATTHWAYAAELQTRRPRARIDADKIFIQDGHVWTSAGVTAGIDLALAMVEEDLGVELSRKIARTLVVYHRRMGGQSQYSALLELDPPSDRIRRALAFAREHLGEPLPVSRLADAACLSERQFARAFMAESGVTPAKAVERLRAEAARPLVEETANPLESIAESVGFSDPERMRQAFVRAFGHPPQALRRLSRAGRAA